MIWPEKLTFNTSNAIYSTLPLMPTNSITISGSAKLTDFLDSISGGCCSKSCLFKITGIRRKQLLRREEKDG